MFNRTDIKKLNIIWEQAKTQETSEPTFYSQNSGTFLAPCLVVRQAGVLARVVGMYTGNVEKGNLILICNLNVFRFF